MAKYFLYLLLFGCHLTQGLQAFELPGNFVNHEIMTEGKFGFYVPMNHRFRDIYHTTKIYGAEVTMPLCNHFAFWAGGSYFDKKGKSIGLNSKTFVRVIPVGAGLKYFVPVCWKGIKGDFYVGAGAEYVYLSTHDHSDFVIKHVRKYGLGGVYKAGFVLPISCNFYMNFYVDYHDKRFSFHKKDGKQIYRVKADIGGLSTGIGIGYRFGVNEASLASNARDWWHNQ